MTYGVRVMSYVRFYYVTAGKTRKIKLDENFFTGYRQTVLEASEVLVDILVPFTEKVTKES